MPRSLKFGFLNPAVIGLVLLCLAGPSAEEAAAQQAQQEPLAPRVTFKGGVEAVTVSVAVRDSRGRVIRDLKRSDFQVIDAGAGREIQDFYTGDSAISLALLLDISGSMAVGGNMDRARSAVQIALANLQSPRDEAALYTFDSKLVEVVPFTTDLDRVKAVNLAGKPWGQTSLYDAIGITARSAADRANRHRALLVITDGVDTGSRMTGPEVSGIASSIDVPVYLVVVVNPIDHPGGEFAVLTAADQSAESATLADLARWTGGDMRIASQPAHTLEAVRDILMELRYQYLISFEPGAQPGWHPLEIRTRQKNHVVHARGGYMSGSAPSGN